MSEPFSKSMQKRIEAQTGERLYTQAELNEKLAAARLEEARHIAATYSERSYRIPTIITDRIAELEGKND